MSVETREEKMVDWTKPIEVCYLTDSSEATATAIAADFNGKRVVVAEMSPGSFKVAHVNDDGTLKDGGARVRNAPAPAAGAGVTLPSGETLGVGCVGVRRDGEGLFLVDEIRGDIALGKAAFLDERPDKAFWGVGKRSMTGAELSGDTGYDLVREATAADFPDGMPLDQVPPKYRDAVAKLRTPPPTFKPTPHEPVKGVTLWNTSNFTAKHSMTAAISVDGIPTRKMIDVELGKISDASGRGTLSDFAVPHTSERFIQWADKLAEFADRIRRERQQASTPPPTRWDEAVTPGGRRVKFLNDDESPECWAIVEGRTEYPLWVRGDGTVRESMCSWNEVQQDGLPNGWHWPAATLANIDAHLAATASSEGEKDPAHPCEGVELFANSPSRASNAGIGCWIKVDEVLAGYIDMNGEFHDDDKPQDPSSLTPITRARTGHSLDTYISLRDSVRASRTPSPAAPANPARGTNLPPNTHLVGYAPPSSPWRFEASRSWDIVASACAGGGRGEG